MLQSLALHCPWHPGQTIAIFCHMRRVLIVVYEGVQTLDMAGPAEVFANARSGDTPYYQVEFAAIGGGRLKTSSALRIECSDLRRLRPQATDIVVVAGGEEPAITKAVADEKLRAWLQRAAKIVRRMTSVCSGAFILAAAGLLDGKRAATHWRACEQLAQMFPNVQVDPNAIYIDAGRIWTSAGVTTGIDMALALVERDLGREPADRLAAELVLYMRRPGFQAQFSEALVAQSASPDELGPAIAWARTNLTRVDIDSLARRAGLSVRTLHRRCAQELKTTPAKLLDKLRVEYARTLLASAPRSAKRLAVECGFGNSTRMRRAFERELGLGPREYRLLHAPA
jgi:transcriptional regulator GlxA family with amidase domain